MDERSSTPKNWELLAREVKRRRVQLQMTQPQVQAAGGPSVSVLSKIEQARRDDYDDMVLARLEVALQWVPGSVEAILSGGRATPTDVMGDRGAQPTQPSDLERPGKWPAEAEAGAIDSMQTLVEILEAQRAALLEQRRAMEEQRREIAELHKKMDQILRDRKGV